MEKFLYYDTSEHPFFGVNHYMWNFRIQITEAALLNRTAVLPKMRIEAKHNFGQAQRLRYDDFVDFKSVLHFSKANPKAQALNCMDEDDFDFNAVGETDTFKSADAISEQDNARCELIIRKTPRWSDLGAISDFLYRQRIFTRWKPARRIMDIVTPVIYNLNGSNAFTRDITSRHRCEHGYVCLHVRAIDYGYDTPQWRNAIRPQTILRNLQRLGLAKNSRLYVMSNIKKDEFFDPIREHYRVFRAMDFPELAALFPSDDRQGDNSALFSAELQIMRCAALRINAHDNKQCSFVL